MARDSRRGTLAEKSIPWVGRPRVDEWVAEACTHTVVERIDSPPGFLADCVGAPGTITVGSSEQEARDEMRSAPADWADLRVARSYDFYDRFPKRPARLGRPQSRPQLRPAPIIVPLNGQPGLQP